MAIDDNLKSDIVTGCLGNLVKSKGWTQVEKHPSFFLTKLRSEIWNHVHDGHFNLRGTNDMASGLCSWHDSANHSVHSEAATAFLQVIYRPKGPLGLRQNDVASGSAMHAHGAATWWRAAPPWGHADAHTSWDAHAIAGHAQPGDDGASRAGALWHAHAAAHDHGTTMWGDPTSTSAHDAYDAYHGCVYAKTSHGLSDPTPHSQVPCDRRWSRHLSSPSTPPCRRGHLGPACHNSWHSCKQLGKRGRGKHHLLQRFMEIRNHSSSCWLRSWLLMFRTGMSESWMPQAVVTEINIQPVIIRTWNGYMKYWNDAMLVHAELRECTSMPTR